MNDWTPNLFRDLRIALSEALELTVEARPLSGQSRIEVGQAFDAVFRVRHRGNDAGLRARFTSVTIRVSPTPFAKLPEGTDATLALGPLEPGHVVQDVLRMEALDAIAGDEIFAVADIEAPIDIEALFVHRSQHDLTAAIEGGEPLDPDADAFANAMYADVLLSNFLLRAWTVKVDDLSAVLGDESAFRKVVSDLLTRAARQRGADADRLNRAIEEACSGYIERHEGSYTGSHAWALWFATIDEDNWYGFDDVRERCADYLGSGNIELRLIKGFDNDGILARASTPVDLPVVANPRHETITIWSAQLND
ncbi:MAG: hypothetical protein AAGA48_26535 [Myxococcota bacterium]